MKKREEEGSFFLKSLQLTGKNFNTFERVILLAGRDICLPLAGHEHVLHVGAQAVHHVLQQFKLELFRYELKCSRVVCPYFGHLALTSEF